MWKKLIKKFEDWKPIHLCWVFNRMGWKIPKYLIGADNWQTPTSGSGWTNNELAWDDDTGTLAQSYISGNSWSPFITLNIDVISCNKVRFWVGRNHSTVNKVDLDVYYGGDWHNILYDDTTWMAWVEIELGGLYSVTSARMSMYNDSSTGHTGRLYEFDFNDVATHLTSTAVIAVSTAGSLSRGITESLLSTANIASSITGRLTRIINLISASVIATSITAVLSRGITNTLNSTSAITTSITSSLSRGVTETLASTANIATSITATLSRGITQTLTSVVNMVTSITSRLTRPTVWTRMVNPVTAWVAVDNPITAWTKIENPVTEWTKWTDFD